MAKAVKTTKPKAPAFKVLEGAQAINTAITGLQRRGKAYEKDLHIAAVSVLNHAQAHGDVTLATKLVDALPGLTRKNALRDWLIAFGPFKYDAENKALKLDRKHNTNLEGAIATPFWEFKQEAEYVPYNHIAAMQREWKKMQKAHEKGEVTKKTVDAFAAYVATIGGETEKAA